MVLASCQAADRAPESEGTPVDEGDGGLPGDVLEDIGGEDVPQGAQDTSQQDAQVPQDAVGDALGDASADDAGLVDVTPEDAMEPSPDVLSEDVFMDAAPPDAQAPDMGPPPECEQGQVERRTIQGLCVDYEQTRRCVEGSFGPWAGDDPSVTCDGGACQGETRTETCDEGGNDTVLVCNGQGQWAVQSRVYGCTTTSDPGAGTRVCPGQTITRSCWPVAGGRARVTWRCNGADAPDDTSFTAIDEDACVARSGDEAGQLFCPGEVILRDNCPVGGTRDYFICPDEADTDTSFVREATVACGEPDVWEPVHRGVALRRWVSGGQRFRALRVDLCDASIRINATRHENRRQRTSAWASSQRWTLAAVNGGFFVPGNPSVPSGAAFGGGAQWPGASNTGIRGFVAFGEGQSWYSEVAYDGPVQGLTPWVEEAVSHDFVMIRAGQVQSTTPTGTAARTGLGFPEDRRTLYLLTVDKGSGSAGMSVNGFAQAFAQAFPDTWSAVRLDGGGSTTLWTHAHGLSNVPSDGSERVVANHLGITLEGGWVGYNCPR